MTWCRNRRRFTRGRRNGARLTTQRIAAWFEKWGKSAIRRHAEPLDSMITEGADFAINRVIWGRQVVISPKTGERVNSGGVFSEK